MTETHLAGPEIIWDGRYMRQRCAWCGTALLDYDLANVQIPEGQDGGPTAWPMLALVRRDGPACYIVPDGPSEEGGEAVKVPDDACVRLDPAVTG